MQVSTMISLTAPDRQERWIALIEVPNLSALAGKAQLNPQDRPRWTIAGWGPLQHCNSNMWHNATNSKVSKEGTWKISLRPVILLQYSTRGVGLSPAWVISWLTKCEISLVECSGPCCIRLILVGRLLLSTILGQPVVVITRLSWVTGQEATRRA